MATKSKSQAFSATASGKKARGNSVTSATNGKQGQKAKNLGGRPTLYSPEIAVAICELVASTTWSMERIAAEIGLKEVRTVYVWLHKHEEFQQQYARAKRFQMEFPMAENMQAIADDGKNDTYVDDDGRVKVDTDHIQRSRLRVETRKWLMAKLAPKKYGEKIDVNHGGQADNPLSLLFSQVAGTPLKPTGGD